MNLSRREQLMQSLPAAADILAIVPILSPDGGNDTTVYGARGNITLRAATAYVLSCLAWREDKEIRLIRRHAARMLARRRNVILPILHGCVLLPVMVRPVDARRGTLGYINTARAFLLTRAAEDGTDITLQSGAAVHCLWQLPAVRRLAHQAAALHYKLLVEVRQQLTHAERCAAL